MNKGQLQADIEAMKERLASMEQQLQECGKPKMFPQEGERYWYYSPQGYVYNNNALDNNVKLNVYKTKAEAERARDIAFAKQRVKFAIGCENQGWTPDWSSKIEYKYCIYYYLHRTFNICEFISDKYQPNWMYMKSKEVAEKILAEHKEDLELIFSE